MKKRIRLDYLDIAKCLTIFLVIMGHCGSNLSRPFYRCVLYTFHMPLFFIVSGITVRKHQTTKYDLKHYKDLIIKNLKALIIPYFLFALIYSSFSYKIIPDILYGSWESIVEAGTLSSLWFIPCLFLSRIEMELILNLSNCFKKLNRHLYAFIAAVICFVVGMNLPVLKQGYPWCFNISIVATGFMLLGYAYKDYLNALSEKNKPYLFILLVLSVVLFVIGINIEKPIYLMRICAAEYGTPYVFFLNAISGCMIILTLSALIAKYFTVNPDSKLRNITLWIGRNTIGIFLLHKPFLQEIVVPLFNSLNIVEPEVVVSIIASAIVLPICCLGVKGIEKVLPQVFGKNI